VNCLKIESTEEVGDETTKATPIFLTLPGRGRGRAPAWESAHIRSRDEVWSASGLARTVLDGTAPLTAHALPAKMLARRQRDEQADTAKARLGRWRGAYAPGGSTGRSGTGEPSGGERRAVWAARGRNEPKSWRHGRVGFVRAPRRAFVPDAHRESGRLGPLGYGPLTWVGLDYFSDNINEARRKFPIIGDA
jgi:hypothetical protein